jgi:NAD:arginine ADP-ribosyltransferase
VGIGSRKKILAGKKVAAGKIPEVRAGANDVSNSRLFDVVLEDGVPRPPLRPLFDGVSVPDTLTEAFEDMTSLCGQQALEAVPAQLTSFVAHAEKVAEMRANLAIEPYASLPRVMKAALVLYTYEDPADRTQSPYFMMNRAIRDRQHVSLWSRYIWLLMHALRRLPSERCDVVYRGCDIAADSLPRQMVETGRTFTLSQFGSTATAVDAVQAFVGDHGTMWHMKLFNDVARDIAPFSPYPKEREVLLPPNCCFEVDSSATLGGCTIVQCHQVKTLDVLLDFGPDDDDNGF